MTEIILTDKSVKPDNQMLSEALGKTYKFWEQIQNDIENEIGKVTPEWKYYGQKYGWTLKLFLKKRNLFFFKPSEKYFTISFVFGDKAVAEIVKSDLSKEIIEEIKNARKYAEGRGLQIQVKKKSDIDTVLKLVLIKVNN